MHRRWLLRGRGEPADIRDGEDRAAGLHGPTDTHLRPSLKLDDRVQRDTDAFRAVTSFSLWRRKKKKKIEGKLHDDNRDTEVRVVYHTGRTILCDEGTRTRNLVCR